jgi:type IV pilus assembly protein PilA
VNARHRAEGGFTLIEVLVVMVIIGIVAAIAVPTMLYQRREAYDAAAQSNASALYTQVESCGVESGGDYTNCTTAAELRETAIPLGGAPGQAQVTGAGSSGFTITAYSQTGKTFLITKSATGRTLTVGGTGSGSW